MAFSRFQASATTTTKIRRSGEGAGAAGASRQWMTRRLPREPLWRALLKQQICNRCERGATDFFSLRRTRHRVRCSNVAGNNWSGHRAGAARYAPLLWLLTCGAATYAHPDTERRGVVSRGVDRCGLQPFFPFVLKLSFDGGAAALGWFHVISVALRGQRCPIQLEQSGKGPLC